ASYRNPGTEPLRGGPMPRKLKLLTMCLLAGGLLAVVAAAASSPAVATGSTTKVTSTSAVLQGVVNPNGSATTYYFQWGLTNTYGVMSASHSAGHGTKSKSVSVTARGLVPGTRYHYRIVATNRFGTSVGRDHSFKTAGHPPA